MTVKSGDRVVIVICIDGEDHVFHVFSSDKTAEEFCKADDRIHVISDRIVDFPQRHEQAAN